jgi:hypothetical protein
MTNREDGEEAEDDPLIDGGLDADAELSDEEQQSDDYVIHRRGRQRAISDENVEKRRSIPLQNQQQKPMPMDSIGGGNQYYHPHSQQQQQQYGGVLPNRLPFMGVNMSTLSHNSSKFDFRLPLFDKNDLNLYNQQNLYIIN